MPRVGGGAPPRLTGGEIVARPGLPRQRRHARQLAHGRLFVLALALITGVGLALRLVWLWPPTQGVIQAPYDDEGVYVMAAQLLRQGYLPYRDFFFAHPPLGILMLTPAVSVAFTPWGSALSFGLARLLVAVMGAATVPLAGLTAARLWGPTGGLIAAGLLAIDPASVANSRHILLDVPMGLLLAAALLAATAREDRPLGPLLSGLLAGLAALVKVQALGLGLALVLVQAWRRRPRPLLLTLAGLILAGAAVLPLGLAAGLDRVLRQVILFQVARPGDGLATLAERLAALLAPGGLLLGLVGAGCGLACAWRGGGRTTLGSVAPVLLWVAAGLAGFLLSRSFYAHYTSQLMPGLAVLAGGIATALPPAEPNPRVNVAVAAPLLLALMLIAPALWAATAPRPDSVFVTVARYVADAAPAGWPVLTTDAQFNFLASRALPLTDGGLLVDSYGQLVYSGLGLDRGDAIGALQGAFEAGRGATVNEIMWRPAAQALLRQHMSAADLVVVHAVGRGRLTPETQAWLERTFRLAETTRRYAIYRRAD